MNVQSTYPNTRDFLVKKSWQLSYIWGCRLNPVGFQGTWEGAEVPGLLALGNKGRTSLCRPERQFPNKRPVLSPLRDSWTWIIRADLLRSTCAAPPVLTYAASVSIHAFERCECFGGKLRNRLSEGSRHLQLSPSQTLVHQHIGCAAQQLSPASPPSLLPLLPVLQLCCNLGTEMWSQRCFLGNKDNLFWGRFLSS